MTPAWPTLEDAQRLLPPFIVDALRDRGIILSEVNWNVAHEYEGREDYMSWFRVGSLANPSNPIPDYLPLFVRVLLMLEPFAEPPYDWEPPDVVGDFWMMHIHLTNLFEQDKPESRADLWLLAVLTTQVASEATAHIPAELLSDLPVKYADIMKFCLGSSPLRALIHQSRRAFKAFEPGSLTR